MCFALRILCSQRIYQKLNNSIKGEQKAWTVHRKRNVHLYFRETKTCHHPRVDGGERPSSAAELWHWPTHGPLRRSSCSDTGIPDPGSFYSTFSKVQRCSCAHIFTVALSVTVKAWRGDTNKTVPKHFPGGPAVKIPHSQCRGAWLRSLIRELDRAHCN